MCDVNEGDELCFSYGERSNDDFFVHYGFVPLRNPRDEVVLFESVEAALDWYVLESGFPVGVAAEDEETLVREMRAIGARLAIVRLLRRADSMRWNAPQQRSAPRGVCSWVCT